MPKIVKLSQATVLSARKIPQQSRATATRSAITQAAAIILQKEGLIGFNTNRIAEVAGISVGSLYQYFPNKAALLSALSIEQHALLYSSIEKSKRTMNGLTLRQTVYRLVDIVFKHQYKQPILAAALDVAERELPMSDEVLAQKKLLLALLVEILSSFKSEIEGNLKIVADDIQVIVQSLIDAAELRRDKNTALARARVKRAVLGYLCFQG